MYVAIGITEIFIGKITQSRQKKCFFIGFELSSIDL
jgi:hypothetical protein